MKKKILFLTSILAIITSVILVSCPPMEEPKNAIIANLTLTSTSSNVFSLGNNSLLGVKAEVEIENESEDTEVIYKWTLTRDDKLDMTDVLTSSYNSVKVSIDELNTLGDYTLKCTSYIKDKEDKAVSSTFIFTINTSEKLEDAFSYSFSSTDNVDLTLDENGITFNKIKKEWGYDRKVITNKEDRPVVGKTIPFEVGNDDVLILSFKDNDLIDKLGELTIETDETNTNYIYTNGYLFYFPNEITEEKTVNLTVKAGTKKKTTIPIKITKASTKDISLPNISVLSTYEKAGGRIVITGDKVSTTYNPIEGGYTLITNIYRTYRIVKGCNEILDDMKAVSLTKVLSESDYKTNEDMCYYIEKENGIEYYFPYAGTYYVESYLRTLFGNTDKVHYSFVIEPATINSSVFQIDNTPKADYSSLIDYTKYKNQKNDVYIDKSSIQNRINIKAIKGEQPLFYVLSFNSKAPSYYKDESFEYKEEEIKTTNTLYQYKMAGEYKIYFHTYDNGNGYGNIPHDSEELKYYLEENNYGVKNSFEIKNLEEELMDFTTLIKITQAELKSDDTTTYTLKGTTELFNTFSRVHIKTFYNNVEKSSNTITSSNPSFTTTTPNNATDIKISLICESNNDTVMTHTAKNYTQYLTKVKIVNLADNLQDRYNYRKLTLDLKELESTDKVYYHLNGSSTYISYTNGQYIYGNKNQTPITIKVVSKNGDTLVVQQEYVINDAIAPSLNYYLDSSQNMINARKGYYYYPNASSNETSLRSTFKSSGSKNVKSVQGGRIYSYNTKMNFYVYDSSNSKTGDVKGDLRIYTEKYGYSSVYSTLNLEAKRAQHPQISRVDSGACGYFRNYFLQNKAGYDQYVYTTIYAYLSGNNEDALIDGHLWDGDSMHCLENPAYKKYYNSWNLLPAKYSSYIPWYNNGDTSPFYRWFTLRYNWEGFYGWKYAGRYAVIKVHMKVEQKGYISGYYTTYLKDKSDQENNNFRDDINKKTSYAEKFVDVNGYQYPNGKYIFVEGYVNIH